MSAQARFFADFHKENDDVNEFPSDTFSLSTVTKSTSGVTVATSTVSSTSGEPLVSSVLPTFAWQDVTFAFGFNQAKGASGVRFDSLSASAEKSAPFGISGVSVSGGVEERFNEAKGGAKSWHLKTEAQFQNELVAASAAGEYALEGGLSQADFTLAVQHSHFGLGGLFSLKPEEKAPWAKAGLAYRQADHSAQLTGAFHEEAKKVDLDVFYQFNDDLALTANVGGKLGAESKLEKKTVSIASNYQINPNASFKSKLAFSQKDENKLRTNLALTQKLSDYAAVTLSANLNASCLLGGCVKPSDHSFGLQVNIE